MESRIAVSSRGDVICQRGGDILVVKINVIFIQSMMIHINMPRI